jgi:hypothetical protein
MILEDEFLMINGESILAKLLAGGFKTSVTALQNIVNVKLFF